MPGPLEGIRVVDMRFWVADFAATPWPPGAPAPELGQRTEEILLELGYDCEAIARMQDTGAIP